MWVSGSALRARSIVRGAAAIPTRDYVIGKSFVVGHALSLRSYVHILPKDNMPRLLKAPLPFPPHQCLVTASEEGELIDFERDYPGDEPRIYLRREVVE